MLNREFNKLIIKLKEDKIIKHDIKIETLEDGRQSLKSVYFFNYGEIKDIIKFKIYKMTQRNQKVNKEMLYCPECENKYSLLDAQRNMEGYLFVCENCRMELKEYFGDEEEMDLREIMEILEPVIEILKETERYEIPTLDYFQMMELKGSEMVKSERNGSASEIVRKERNGSSSEMVRKERESVQNRKDRDQEEKKESAEEEFLFSMEQSMELNGHTKDEKLTGKEQKDKEIVREQRGEEPEMLLRGEMRKLKEITEEEIDGMDESEYVNYFELCRQGEGEC